MMDVFDKYNVEIIFILLSVIVFLFICLCFFVFKLKKVNKNRKKEKDKFFDLLNEKADELRVFKKDFLGPKKAVFLDYQARTILNKNKKKNPPSQV